jgi:putative transposase
MRFDPGKHHRRSIRLKQYDYTQTGAYFVTACTQNRECFFGEIVDGVMRLTYVGEMIQKIWQELPEYYAGVGIDVFTIMPNHIHGIIILTNVGDPTIGAGPPVGAGPVGVGPRAYPHPITGQPRGVVPTGQVVAPMVLSLPDVVHRFKSLTTARYRKGVSENRWMPLCNRLWQHNYYEHIIRNEDELNRIRQYIEDNPLKWEMDRENPTAQEIKNREIWQV